MIQNNKIIKQFKKREEQYIENTELIIEIFHSKLKWALEKAVFEKEVNELIINNVNIDENNFHFLNIIGFIILYKVGEEIPNPDKSKEMIKITSKNLLEFTVPISLILPVELLDTGEEVEIYNYMLKLKDILENVDNLQEFKEKEEYSDIFENPACKGLEKLKEQNTVNSEFKKDFTNDLEKSIYNIYENIRTVN